MDRDAVRSAVGLCVAAPAARAGHVRFEQADGLVAAGGARGAGTAGRQAGDWSRLDEFLLSPTWWSRRCARRSLASSLAATLELVREGQIEVHQQPAFAPLYLRKRDGDGRQRVRESSAGPLSAATQRT